MSAEWVTAYAALGTLVVIGASAVAALIQLRHIRASNQIEAVLALEKDFRSVPIQDALRYVQSDLPGKLADAAYRSDLSRPGFVDATDHPELVACNWFNEMGALMKYGFVTEAMFMDMFGRLIVYYWKALAPVVALMRRSRSDVEYHDFEYLAACAARWLTLHPGGVFPKRFERLPLPDPWPSDQ